MGINVVHEIRSYLKNVFWPNFCVGSSFQLLGILEYACGLNLGPALILNQNPIFEMASSTELNQIWVQLFNFLISSVIKGTISKRSPTIL
jgi:hypothetical protein